MRLFTTPKKLYEKLEKQYSGKNACILGVGVGRKKFPGSIGIDIRPHSEADIVHDLNRFPWPCEDDKLEAFEKSLFYKLHCAKRLPLSGAEGCIFSN